jgi:hypothetical protein
MLDPSQNANAKLPGEHILNRIAVLTLGVGFVSAAVAFVLHRADWAKGLAGGAVLAWLNFRWLSRGIRAMVISAVARAPLETEDQQPAVAETQVVSDTAAPLESSRPATSDLLTFLAMIFRYALVALGVYVIFIYLHVPLISLGFGLCAFVVAILVASVWEAVRPGP